jgi:hypothetical protein
LNRHFQERGLPTQFSALQLGEAILEPNATVRVWGERSEERTDTSAGYRERALRTVLFSTPSARLVIASP